MNLFRSFFGQKCGVQSPRPCAKPLFPYRKLACERLEERRLLSGGINEFLVPTPMSSPLGITAGPDGNLWFTEFAVPGSKTGRITPAGAVTEPVTLTTGCEPFTIVTGPDSNLWFTEVTGNKIGRLAFGSLTEFPVPTPASDPNGIVSGSDGNLWFTEMFGNKIGRITPTGSITEFAVPTGNSEPYGIAAGPDGNLWFAEAFGNQIGRITPTGVITEFRINTSGSQPLELTPGPDGNLWFTENLGDKIGRITTAGSILEYSLPTANSQPTGITAGADGNVWFDEFNIGKIGRITPRGVITEFSTPTARSFPADITSGPDGNLWFTEAGADQIGQLVLDKGLTPTGTTITPTEGSPFTGAVASFADADPAATPSSFTATIAWGDGATAAGTVTANSTGGFNVSGEHTYAEEGHYAVTVTLTDIDTSHDLGQNAATAHSTATVRDAPLSVQAFNVTAPRITGPQLLAVFSDAGGPEPASSYVVTINWGDGSALDHGTVTANGTLFTVTGSHVYPQNGTYTVKLAFYDEGGATARVNDTAVVSSVYPLTPAQVRHAYGVDALPRASNDGTGETIAIVDAYDDPTIFQDLNTFDQTFSVTPGQTLFQQYGSSTQVLTKATPGGTPAADAGWAQEISLDVQWAHAIAPGAHILLVEAKTNSLADLLVAVDYATNHGAAVVSMSFGAGEFSQETALDGYFAHAGVTYVASAGDTGSVTEWPAVSPNVVGVGGTSLTVDGTGTYGGETGWSGSGGGFSSYEPRPGYQANVPQSGSARTSPDVAYDADPNTGVAIYDSYGSAGGWDQVAGTSAGAPQWAALVAIADQGRATPLSSVGTLNALYALLSNTNTINATYLHDITSGSSGTYAAGPGYDLVTGLGTPRADTLIPYLRGAAPGGVRPNITGGNPAGPTAIKAVPLHTSIRSDATPALAQGGGLSSVDVDRAFWAVFLGDSNGRRGGATATFPGFFSPNVPPAAVWRQSCTASFAAEHQAPAYEQFPLSTALVPAGDPETALTGGGLLPYLEDFDFSALGV
jgi:streptogramin lyase